MFDHFRKNKNSISIKSIWSRIFIISSPHRLCFITLHCGVEAAKNVFNRFSFIFPTFVYSRWWPGEGEDGEEEEEKEEFARVFLIYTRLPALSAQCEGGELETAQKIFLISISSPGWMK